MRIRQKQLTLMMACGSIALIATTSLSIKPPVSSDQSFESLSEI